MYVGERKEKIQYNASTSFSRTFNFKKGYYEGKRASLASHDWSILKRLELEGMWKHYQTFLI